MSNLSRIARDRGQYSNRNSLACYECFFFWFGFYLAFCCLLRYECDNFNNKAEIITIF